LHSNSVTKGILVKSAIFSLVSLVINLIVENGVNDVLFSFFLILDIIDWFVQALIILMLVHLTATTFRRKRKTNEPKNNK